MAKKPDTPCSGCGKLLWCSKTSAAKPQCRECRRRARNRAEAEAAEVGPRACEGCGAEFIPRRSTQRRCRKGCGKQGDRAPRMCEVCRRQYRPSHKAQRTCSRDCGATLRRSVTGTLPTHQQWPSSPVYFLNCPCGRLFAGRRSNARFCPACLLKPPSHRTMLRYYADPAFRDRVLAQAHARRAGKLGAGHELITISYLSQRDGNRCGICRTPVRGKRGTSRGPSIDHIVPLTRGGMHELANVQLAHLDCNLSKNCRGGGEQMLLFG